MHSLAEQSEQSEQSGLGVGKLRCWAGALATPTASLLSGTSWSPKDPLGWGLVSVGRARVVLKGPEVSKSSVHLNSK